MATIDMKLKELQAIPEAVEILKKHVPKTMKSPYLKMGKNMTFRAIAEFPQAGVSKEVLDQIEAELQAL